ncbi:MAG: Trk system potassium transporter TrkA [Wenzhouxiangellaceae bacterium]|jgi:trk system potassium uptake protein TrkA|nr:Trk system potassium transporter TrkA [Wenzhouxiangellaceae bacterium]MBS3745645.1 Trk system potassium transporter TrkA [Wenzhouxiangellaceae bacterium]MBS3822455.1 Trk system potassium transporter TrkA [Wenzhouxiangellaceae bacterium]
MKIIILGAGQVGSGMAHSLSREENDISVVDTDPERLRELQEKLDIRTVLGHASRPETLIRAGIEDTELLIALTNSDETNMIACQVAYSLFNTPTKVARIRAADYLAHPELFTREHTPIDYLISPEKLVTDHVQRLIEYPGALQVLDFADGRAQLVATRAVREGKLVGRALKSLPDELPAGVDARVAAIFRRDEAIIPEGDTVIEVDDMVFFLAPTQEIREVMATFGGTAGPARRVLLAGGGNIGAALARRLERNLHVKIIERDATRAERIAEGVDTSIVLVGDCANEDLLREEGIDEMDVYCALTNDDEANILSSMLAKRMGAHKVITLINRAAYVDLVESDRIDVAVSPQQITIGALLALIRKGHMVRVHSLRQGAAEAIEVVAHGDPGRSKIVGREIGAITLPESTTIGAVVRGDEVLMAHHNVVIEPEDHVILFVADKREIADVERLFAVEAVFV